MGSKRLFLGSFIEYALIEQHYAGIQKEFKNITTGKWVEKQNLHITYKFLGDIDESDAPKIKAALSEHLDKPLPAELYFGAPSSFNINSPRILFIKIDDRSKATSKLNDFVENKLEAIGYHKEPKPFTPHLTIQRIKSADPTTFKQALEKFKLTQPIGPQTNISLKLIESVLTPSGPIYKAI